MTRANRRWWTIGGVWLDIDGPLPDAAPSARFWWPLHRAARMAAHDGHPDLLPLDEFTVVGVRWRRRPNRPLWIYLHQRTNAELFVTDEGETFRLAASGSEAGAGRFVSCRPEVAARHAGLPDLPPGTLPGGSGVRSDEGLARWGALLPPPVVHPYDAHADRYRFTRTWNPFLSGRMVRWPFGPGPHRLDPDPPLDELGRCFDHWCDRCYRDPAPSLSGHELRQLGLAFEALDARSAELRAARPTEPASSAPAAPPAPPRPPTPVRRRPVPTSPYRPLRLAWPLPPPSPN